MSGVNDLSVGGDITLTGNLDGITPTNRAQLANIGATTISTAQWGYLGGLDQALATSDSPTFAGLDLSNNRITGVLDPTLGQDAATKSYVDTVAATGSAPLEQADLATSTALPDTPSYASPAETLTSTGGPGSLTVDGIAVSVGDRILVKDQSPNTQNGVYDVTDDGATPGPNWVLTRSSDFNQAAMPIPSGTTVFVSINGSALVNSASSWALQATVNDVDPLTDAVVWVQVGGIQTLSAGNGIDPVLLAGGTVATDITARLTYTGGEIDLNTVTVPYGGTGSTSLTSGNVLVGQGASPVSATKAAPTGDFVGTTDSQTLTNKTITSSTNNVISRELFVDSGSSSVSTFAASPPTSGQVLTATSATVATWQTPATAAFEPDRTLFVYQSATNVRPNWDSVNGALTDAALLTPTAANPVLILVYPGTYAESTPMTVPANVSISAATYLQASVVIRPTAPAASAAVFILNGSARLSGIVVDGFDGTAAYATMGVHSAIGTPFSIDYLTAVTCRNCSLAGVRVSGNTNQFSKILVAKNVSCQVTVSAPFVATNGFLVDQGGVLAGNDFNATGFLSGGGVMTNGCYVLDQFSFFDGINFQVSSVTNGIVVGAGTVPSAAQETYPLVRITQSRIALVSAVAIRALAKSVARLTTAILDDDSGLFPNRVDLEMTSPALPNDPNLLVLQSVNLELSRLSLFNGATNNFATILGQILSTEVAEPQQVVTEKLVIGQPLQGREMVAGEGNSHTLGMVVLKDDGGVFTDITGAVKLPGTNTTTNAIDTDLATTAAINLASAPATIDGVIPTSGVSRILVKDGSTANPGTDSVDNGVYVWNGTGSAMTRATDFAAGGVFFQYTFFLVEDGDTNYRSVWKIDASTFPAESITVGTTSFGLEAFSSTVFPLVPANNDALYIGSDISLKFFGLKYFVTAGLELSSGSPTDAIVWEYWNGSAWATIPTMTTKSNAPYTSFGDDSFGFGDSDLAAGPANYQIRFGPMTSWSTTTVNGTAGFWIRVRVIDASLITQVPVVEQFKLHTNRTEINNDGFMEYFGNARPRVTFNVQVEAMMEAGTLTAMRDQTIIAPDTAGREVSGSFIDARFRASSDCGITGMIELDEGACTSCPLEFKLKWVRLSTGSATGNVAWAIYYAYTGTGDTLNISGEVPTATAQTTGITTTAVTATPTHQETSFSIDLSAYEVGQQIWFEVVRVGTDAADTFTSGVTLFSVTYSHRKWSNGGFRAG